MANLADLLINLRADPSGIEEGMSKGKKLALAGGAAIGAAVGAAALESMDISAANDKLAAQLGLNAEESARVGKVAGNLFAGAYGDNIGEVNTAVGAVMSSIKGMSKASSADLQSVTTKALDFAGAFDVDVARAVDVAGRAVSSGLAKNATEAFDLITAASQKVPANLREDVLDATDEYGQFFHSIGIDGPDAFGIMVDAAQKGMFGIDKVGDAVKEFTIRATDGSASTVAAMKSIGVNSGKMSDAILGGGKGAADATQSIIDGLLGIKNPSKQAQTAIALFGTPLEDLNVKDIPEFLKTLQSGSDSLGDFAGAAADMGATLNDNASTNLTSFKRQAQLAFVRVVGGKVIPIVDSVARFLAGTLGPAIAGITASLDASLVPALKASARFIEANQTPIKIVAGVISVLLLPALSVLAVQAARTAAASVAAWARQTAAAVRGAAAGVAALTRVAVQWVISAARSIASAAIMAASWLVAIGPIALVIAAVVGLTVLIVKNWDKILAATKKIWGWISGAISNAVSGIVNWVKSHWPLILAILTGPIGAAVVAIAKNWDKIKAGVSAVKDWVVARFDDVVSAIAGLPARIGRAAAGLFDGIKDAFRSAINWVIGAWNGLEFHIPGFDPPGPGPKFGGFTLGVPDIPYLATGGPLAAGQAAIVGERGPELFVPRTAGRVDPNNALGGDITVIVEIDGQQLEGRIKRVVADRDRGIRAAVTAGGRRAYTPA